MTPYDRYEFKLASAMIGLTEVLWSFIAFIPGHSVFYQILSEHEMAGEWGVLMFCIGALTSYGALRPCRKSRHMGLVLGVFLWLAMYSAFAIQALWTPVAVLMPVFAIFSLLLLLQDARHGQNSCNGAK
jgi:hypothetical protein